MMAVAENQRDSAPSSARQIHASIRQRMRRTLGTGVSACQGAPGSGPDRIERAAYDAPFPDESYRAGPRQFPLIVPLGDADPPGSMLRAAWAGLERYERPFVTALADQEDVTRFFEPLFQERRRQVREVDHLEPRLESAKLCPHHRLVRADGLRRPCGRLTEHLVDGASGHDREGRREESIGAVRRRAGGRWAWVEFGGHNKALASRA